MLDSAPPRFRNVPAAPSSAGQEAVDLAASAGLFLDPWQQDVLIGALGESADGGWAATEVGVTLPRQNGKGAILEARELFGLFLDDRERLQTHTAHRFDTCLEHFKRIRDLIEGTPDLARKVKRIREANGDEGIELLDGSRLNFKARSKGSGRGFSGDLVVLDEAFWLMELGSLIPTMSGRPNPQVWYTSSAPLPRVESDVLRRIIKRGRAGGKMAYFEWSVTNPEDWAQANPALGYRMSEEFIDIERGSLTPAEFALERCGIFPDPDAQQAPKWAAVSAADWAARQSGETEAEASQPGWLVGEVALAIELTTDRTTSTIAAAGVCREGGIGADIVAQGQGTAWVVDHVKGLAADKSRPVGRVVIDPRSPAGSLIGDLTAAGVAVTECPTVDLVKATGSLFDDIRDGAFVHRGSPELTAAVAAAKTRKYGDASLIDRWGDADVTPFIAVDLARWGHLQGPVDSESIYEDRGPLVL